MANHEEQGEWTRSENLRTDLARALENGDFYDCTFQVTSKQAGEKKVIYPAKFVVNKYFAEKN
jgi:hypothetical protein